MSHWYYKDGSPFYTMLDAKGKERDTTLRDARKIGALYSTTTIIGQIAKPSLTRWKLQRLLAAAYTPQQDYASLNDWQRKVLDLYKEDTEQYQKKGTIIHNKLEAFYKTNIIKPQDEDLLWPVIELVKTLGYSTVEAEKCFASKEGYGGCIDLVLDNGKVLIDFKTKKESVLDSSNVYIDYMMQLAAYREAIYPTAKCFNILISTSGGVPFKYEWSEKDLQKGWQMFKCLRDYAILANNYDPREVE